MNFFKKIQTNFLQMKLKKKLILISTALVIGLVILFLAGPRTQIDTQIRHFDLPENLDQYLAQSESRFSNLIPNTEKTIIWTNPEKTKTPIAIVYLHGFSATRQESAPP